MAGFSATRAPSASGHCVSVQALPCCSTRTTAPRRTASALARLGARPGWAWRSPALSMRITSPEASTAVTALGLARVTMAARKSSSSSTPGQQLRNGGVVVLQVGGQVFVVFRPAPGLAQGVLDQRAAQRLLGRLLLGGDQRGGDVNALGVGLLAKLRKHLRARHFGHVLGVHLHLAASLRTTSFSALAAWHTAPR